MVRVAGTMPTVEVGEELQIAGEWEDHRLHGKTFRAGHFQQTLPATEDAVRRYLDSGAIKGIGPATSARLIEAFGARILDILETEPEALASVPGITPKRLRTIRESWRERKRLRELVMFLQEHGIRVSLAIRLEEVYGDEAVAIVQRDPYRLAHDIPGIGFHTADAIAGRLGVSKTSMSRQVAGLRQVLVEAADEGSVFLPRHGLLERAAHLLAAPVDALEPALLEFLRCGYGAIECERVYLAAYYRAETGAAEMLERIRATASVLSLDSRFQADLAVLQAGNLEGIRLSETQQHGAQNALREKVAILTGGPGTGKTSTLRTLITVLERAQLEFCQCAPTGRAAKRLAETTGRQVFTIHRLLEFQPHGNVFGFDQRRPLPYDFVIVDEVSMLDIVLFYHLLKAVPPESHLVLVGDPDQLPSVGPGNVLRDLLESGTWPAVELKELFRQGPGSQIAVAAQQINQGRIPAIFNEDDSDLFFIECADEIQVVSIIKELVKERIPRRFGLDPIEDVQVLSPMRAGPAGVLALNQEMQSLLNPTGSGAPEIERRGTLFRVRDKVMQVRNNYDRGVYNGDVGIVVSAKPLEGVLVVAFETEAGGIEIEYRGSELDELSLAYATTVHKAQGSEHPCIVMPLVTRHFMLLQRNLLYTAVTRARMLCVLVGVPRALALGVHGDRCVSRHTSLAQRMRSARPDLTPSVETSSVGIS